MLIDSQGYAKLTDFGLSKENIRDNHSATTFCGTPEYLAPEVLAKRGHGKAVDWWSLGSLIYEMLTGLPPFYVQDRRATYRNIMTAQVTFPKSISPRAQDLLIRLLEKEPNRRLGGSYRDSCDVKEHPWFSDINWEAMFNKSVSPPYIPNRSHSLDLRYFSHEFTNCTPTESSLEQNQRSPDCSPTYDGFTYEGSPKYLEDGFLLRVDQDTLAV